MKKTKLIYWVLTGLFAFVMVGSAIPDIFSATLAVEGFKKIGYPAYLVPFVGIAKLLGSIVILVPGYPRLKEWAYAGLIIDLTGATYSIMSSGAPPSNWIGMAVPLALAFGSYVYYHKKLQVRKYQIQ